MVTKKEYREYLEDTWCNQSTVNTYIRAIQDLENETGQSIYELDIDEVTELYHSLLKGGNLHKFNQQMSNNPRAAVRLLIHNKVAEGEAGDASDFLAQARMLTNDSNTANSYVHALDVLARKIGAEWLCSHERMQLLQIRQLLLTDLKNFNQSVDNGAPLAALDVRIASNAETRWYWGLGSHYSGYRGYVQKRTEDDTLVERYIHALEDWHRTHKDTPCFSLSMRELKKLSEQLRQGGLQGFDKNESDDLIAAVEMLYKLQKSVECEKYLSKVVWSSSACARYIVLLERLQSKIDVFAHDLSVEELHTLHTRLRKNGDLYQLANSRTTANAVGKLIELKEDPSFSQTIPEYETSYEYLGAESAPAVLHEDPYAVENIITEEEYREYLESAVDTQTAVTSYVLAIEELRKHLENPGNIYELSSAVDTQTAVNSYVLVIEELRKHLGNPGNIYELSVEELKKLYRHLLAGGDLYEFSISIHKKDRRITKQAPSAAIGQLIKLKRKKQQTSSTPTDDTPEVPATEETQPYTVQNIIDDGCFLEEDSINKMLSRLEKKKNIILQGPPGTGKTWLAKRLAYALMGSKNTDALCAVQFHPNMSYEDFIRGWRPVGEGRLNLADGPFLKMVNKAKTDIAYKHVVVIEEINRGNPAQIFGEMLTLLEADKRTKAEELRLAYGEDKVYIPENLYVIGTMNIADRSLALVDLALRRRFAFFPLEPLFTDSWRDWVSEHGEVPDDTLATIQGNITALNETIANDKTLGKQFRIGHSYLMPNEPVDDAVDWYRDVVEYEIYPLLQEYWFDNPKTANTARDELLNGV